MVADSGKRKMDTVWQPGAVHQNCRIITYAPDPCNMSVKISTYAFRSAKGFKKIRNPLAGQVCFRVQDARKAAFIPDLCMVIGTVAEQIILHHSTECILVAIRQGVENGVIADTFDQGIKEKRITKIEEDFLFLPPVRFQIGNISFICLAEHSGIRIIREDSSFPIAENMMFFINNPAQVNDTLFSHLPVITIGSTGDFCILIAVFELVINLHIRSCSYNSIIYNYIITDTIRISNRKVLKILCFSGI